MTDNEIQASVNVTREYGDVGSLISTPFNILFYIYKAEMDTGLNSSDICAFSLDTSTPTEGGRKNKL